ncbi:MAG: hypothetical protein JWO96_645 [Candidatus Saccharibacteria bacterium]|nr:hypothetical protein [Candidatus Saccharibacteria bacterium]
MNQVGELLVQEAVGTPEVSRGGVKEFLAYVEKHNDLLVVSPRLPGLELPFGAMISACGVEHIREDNVHKFWDEAVPMVEAALKKQLEAEANEEATVEGEELGPTMLKKK